MTIAGAGHFEGIIFTAGATTDNANIIVGTSAALSQRFKNSKLALGGSNAAARITLGNSGGNAQLIYMTNTTMSFASASQKVVFRSKVIWENTASALLGTIPTSLFTFAATYAPSAKLVGVDLSAAGSGKTLVDQTIDADCEVNFLDCKLGSSVTIGSGSGNGFGSAVVRAVNCDSGDTNYRYYLSCYEGTITSETTVVRTGGATDGTTAIARKMVGLATARFYCPLRSDWISFWDNTTGSKTVTIYVITDNVTLTDREAWVEVEYLGTSGFPLGLLASDAAADTLATAANQTTDTSTWNTTGISTPVYQKLSTTFTTTGKGQYRARVCLAKATTMYFDPFIATGARQYMVGEGGYLNAEAGGNSAGVFAPLIAPTWAYFDA